MRNTTVNGNQAVAKDNGVDPNGDGGGLVLSGSAILINSTVSNNAANNEGGGIQVFARGEITLTHTTLVNNTAPNGAGFNIREYQGETGTVRLENTIIANSGLNCNIATVGTFISFGYNLGSDNSCNLTATGDIINTDPLLGLLQNNGGNTETHAPSRFDSRIIDAIPSEDCPEETDQRGVSRPQGADCDIGAYESDDILVRVFSETETVENIVSGAFVYHQPAGQTTENNLIGSSAGTDAEGYSPLLQSITVDDTLMALLPVSLSPTLTQRYSSTVRLFHTSKPYTVFAKPSVVSFTVSSANPLILFDLAVSLEWDARNDPTYLNSLQEDLRRASQILYDLTNGQAALGNIIVHQNKENWLNADIAIYATNNLRPNANLGGIVTGFYSETLQGGQVITDAYEPGQVRMGATWNRFGNSSGNLGEDWSRALAHELGHYLFFLLDNYLGLDDQGRLLQTDCQDSAMTDAYRESYSEFLTPADWTDDCLKTLAAKTTGRPDWQTIIQYYPMLTASTVLTGPHGMPPGTTITLQEPETADNTLAAPFFYLVDADGQRLTISPGGAQGYLFKTHGNADPADDYLIPVGVPNRDLLWARGAAPGDRLCVFDHSQVTQGQRPLRLGCLDGIGETASDIILEDIPNWPPQITVRPVTSRTLAVTVTLAASETALTAQVLPAYGFGNTSAVTSPVVSLVPVHATNSLIFSQTVTLDYPAFTGFVRIWAPDANPQKETITTFYLSGNWGANFGGGEMANFGGGEMANTLGWQAPVASNDGQIIIFNVDNILSKNTASSLQALMTLPTLDPWLTLVGQAYRFSTSQALTDRRTIQFQYLERDVPNGQEADLSIYHRPDGEETWQRLDTIRDTYRNLASAIMQGEGVYMLVATVPLPLYSAGWNLIAYPVRDTQPVTQSLRSIASNYNTVYSYVATDTLDPWKVHSNNAPNWVNDLEMMVFGQGYWINVTEAITLYLPSASDEARETTASVPNPPATYYGEVVAGDGFAPSAGMAIIARVDDQECGWATITSNQLDGEMKLVYVIDVWQDDGQAQAGCGISGRTVTFEVGGQMMLTDVFWRNDQVYRWNLGLDPKINMPYGSYLPFILKK